MSAMGKADRANVERLARKRAKVAKSMIGERVKVLRAEVEDQLAAEYKVDDALWADLAAKAQAEVAKADAQIEEICARLGIGPDLRPSLRLGWSGRGENMLASRRTELRKLAYARIDAAAESAKVTIEANLLQVETDLIRGGLESSEAVAYVDRMPTVEDLLPAVDVGQLDPGPAQRRSDTDDYRGSYGGWEPPVEAAGQLLAPSTASGREAKRQAIAAALAANPDASNRRVGEITGADHKTVGKYRAEGGENVDAGGDFPAVAGEFPTEFPTTGGDAAGGER